MATARPAGFLLLDRHIEKNAGSTFREIMWRNELNGKCLYWGYLLRSSGWKRVLGALRNLTADAVPPRLCAEAHTGIDQVVPWRRRLDELQALRVSLVQRRVPMRLLLVLRVREPLSFYISFYTWAVAERQSRSPAKFGSSFEEWLRRAPNLQSELVVSSRAATTAAYANKAHPEVRAWRRRWDDEAMASRRRALVWQMVRAYDVLGVTDMFDETALVVARALGWGPDDAVAPSYSHEAPQAGESCSLMTLMAARQRRAAFPWWCRDPWKPPASEQRRVHAHVCPNVSACAELVAALSPLDVELYEHARRRLRSEIAAAGAPFRAQLRRLRKAKHVLTMPKCAWRPLVPRVYGRVEPDTQRLLAIAPNFSSSGTCVRGDQGVMRAVWAEHGNGGRAKPGTPVMKLVRFNAERSRRHDQEGAGPSVRRVTLSPEHPRMALPPEHPAHPRYRFFRDRSRGV